MSEQKDCEGRGCMNKAVFRARKDGKPLSICRQCAMTMQLDEVGGRI